MVNHSKATLLVIMVMPHLDHESNSPWDKLNDASGGRLDELVREMRKAYPALTKMEARVSVLYLERYDQGAISRKLCIDLHTVENHAYNIRVKLHALRGARFNSLFEADETPPNERFEKKS